MFQPYIHIISDETRDQMWGRVKGAFSAAKAFATLSMDIGRDEDPEHELMAAMTDELDVNSGTHSTHLIESDELRKSSKVKIAWVLVFLTGGGCAGPTRLVVYSRLRL